MFDTMTMTKVVGALCGAFLVFLLGGWAAEAIYTAGEGGDPREQAYKIDTGEDEAASTETADASAGPPFEEVFASADPAAGEKLFKQCAACHKVNGENATGPHLNGVIGRDVGTVADFQYSSAMAGHGGVWEPAEVSQFIANPKGYVPGTKMGYAGMKKIEDRANVISYLASLK